MTSAAKQHVAPQVSADLELTLIRCAEGSLPANVALMHLIAQAERPAQIDAALARAIKSSPAIESVRRLWHDSPLAWDTVRDILAATPHMRRSPEQWAAAFDRAAAICPDAAVALYSLGRSEILDHATRSIAGRLQSWGLLEPERSVLDLGCGSGRMLPAIAPHVRLAVGAEISSTLLAAARQRCAAIPNAVLVQVTGRDLCAFRDEAFDLILAVDAFPYLVDGGDGLAAQHITEARRTLKQGGSLVILNYSYRGRPEDDRTEIRTNADRNAFELVRTATEDFEGWDGQTFHLRRMQ